MTDTIAVIDSHIHLYEASHLQSLNWTSSLAEDHVLKQQRSVQDYRADTKDCSRLIGFVFLETDRKSSSEAYDWIHPLQEIDFLARIVRGRPDKNDGFSALDGELVLGMVPWAPLVAGPAALREYLEKAREACGDAHSFSLIKGFRYLVQDKPQGTMLRSEFIAGLRWLGEHGLSFDLGVDARSGGLWQLQEACEMLNVVYSGGNNLKVVINHCCKPNLHISAQDVGDVSTDYSRWAQYIRTMAGYPNTYVKLSGFLSELPTQSQSMPTPMSELTRHLTPWLDTVFEAFGPSRIMFGSDWPVCTANGLNDSAWQYWHDLVTEILDDRGLSVTDKKQIWSETAIRAYGIKL